MRLVKLPAVSLFKPLENSFPSLARGQPALILAPMEGVTDAPMRALMTERGGFRYCVSEFLRVSSEVPPAKVFLGHVPELKKNCQTDAGCPVQIQILGGDPERMARAANLAYQIGARAIDINFGCPAPTVNRHDGGATLLKYPDRIFAIVKAVRDALPKEIPVSAKMRLGWDTQEPILLNAERAAEAGAAWITIHGRTKMQGYMPPAYWRPIGEVRKRVSIPIVANGDIWSFEDFLRCQEETGAEHFMLGRSALADPNLVYRISEALGSPVPHAPQAPLEIKPFGVNRAEWVPLLLRFIELSEPYTDHPRYLLARIKQWMRLVFVSRKIDWFDTLKRLESLDEVFALLEGRSAFASAEMIKGSECQTLSL